MLGLVFLLFAEPAFRSDAQNWKQWKVISAVNKVSIYHITDVSNLSRLVGFCKTEACTQMLNFSLRL